ncbi:unannotated protein [freshwater metagenome]|uniref:Unannotated protein n=1 Tax=freshwater metagenome TaxID=449393 RepID=A0A6J7TQX0_9ZZZZ
MLAVIVDMQLSDHQRCCRWLCITLFDLENDIAAHHELGKTFFICFLRRSAAGYATIAQNDNAVSNCHDLTEFVGNKKHAHARSCQVPHHLQELVGLLRCQNCGGFIKDEQINVFAKRLENFDALLRAHRKIFDKGIWIYLKAILFRECQYFCACRFHINEDAALRLASQNNVFSNRHHGNELEVLVHHAHTTRNCPTSISRSDNFTLDTNLSRIRTHHAEDALHKGGFSGTIFSEQSHYFASSYRD